MNAAPALRLVGKPPQAVTYAVLEIPIARIRAFAFQPRKWFDPEEIAARADSMLAMGQQDPVTVERVTGDPAGTSLAPPAVASSTASRRRETGKRLQAVAA